MYIKNGIAYAGKEPPLLKVVKVKFIGDYKISVLFNNFKEKTIDFKPLLKYPCYKKLKNIDLFKKAKVDVGGYGVIWDSEIDISADSLYYN